MAENELKISGVFIGLSILVVSIILYSFPAWVIILLAAEGLESFGIYLPPVGQVGTIDSGAVLVASIYLLLCMIGTKSLFRRKQRYIASTVAVGGCFCSVVVFALVSSIIWF